MVELTQKQILEKQLATVEAQKTILQNNYDIQMPQLIKRAASLTSVLESLD